MSKFPSRYNRASDPNVHVRALVEQLKVLGFNSKYPLRVDMIDHTSTQQKTIRVHIEGTQRPNEIVVLGAHFDSITMSGNLAPGSDDNASGSANLLDALRVLITKPAPARSVEFFWYAGEESGLLGSAEIAKAYKSQKANVVGALQLDMTLFPGTGSGKIGMMTDYTSPWLRDFVGGLNTAYVGAELIDSSCGYGCSDHASWYRQGYPTVIPFEATMDDMNHNIHTPRDIINAQSNFDHSLLFSKLALSYVLELANSTQKQPF
jgi:leucyl aminopeptidase